MLTSIREINKGEWNGKSNFGSRYFIKYGFWIVSLENKFETIYVPQLGPRGIPKNIFSVDEIFWSQMLNLWGMHTKWNLKPHATSAYFLPSC